MSIVHFLNGVDIVVFQFLHGFIGQSPYLNGLIFFCAQYLPFILPVLLVLLIIRSKYSFNQGILIAITSLISVVLGRLVVVEGIRLFYHRLRPFVYMHLQPLFIVTSDSFPSGHATLYFAFAFVVFHFNRRWGYWFIAGAAVISIARVMAGVHYPTDIIAGALIGWSAAWVSVWLSKRYVRHTRKRV